MKRTIVFIVVLALTLSMLVPVWASDEAVQSPAMVCADRVSTSGDTVEVSVSISGNPGLASYLIRLKYDTSMFSVIMNDGEPAILQGNFSTAGTLLGTQTSTGCEVTWFNTRNVYSDGVLFKVQLRIAEGTPVGEYPIRISYSAKNTVNLDEELVALSCSDGSVSVTTFTPTLSLPSFDAKTNDTVILPISISDNPGLEGMDVFIEYDTNVFSPVCGEDGSPAVTPSDAFSKGLLLASEKENGCRILWSNTSEVKNNGEFVRLALMIKPGTAPGSYPISIRTNSDNTLNANGESVTFVCTQGSVAVQTTLTHIPARVASCTADGNPEYWFDTATGKYYADEHCIREIALADMVIPALGHDYVNGECTRCHEKDPDYKPVIQAGRIIVSNARARAGEEFTATVSIEDNPGVMAIALGIDYDSSKLEYLGFEDGILSGWMVASNAVWLGSDDVSENGVILKLKFRVLDDVEDGDIQLSVLFSSGDIANHNEVIVLPESIAGTVTVYSRIPGDVTDDGKVNALDLIRLQRYLSGENVVMAGSGDITGDSKVNALDLIRLQRYLSGEAVEIF